MVKRLGTRRWAGTCLASTAIIVIALLPALADGPAHPAYSPIVPRSNPCIAAGNEGPFFSLRDLQVYVPPRKLPTTATPRPPAWRKYPAALHNFALPPREVPAEEVEYLTTHEIRHGDPQSHYVALTFDCESSPSRTRKLLAVLREHKVKATFFILGKYAYNSPQVIREIAADGHEFGNHSFFHPSFAGMSPITITHEITYTEAAIDMAVGRHISMRYFRFPYGGRDRRLRAIIATLGYRSAFWDLDPFGWKPDVTAQDVEDYIRNNVHPGGVVIMHCHCMDDITALPGVIEVIRARGLEPGTLSDALAPPGP